jgi:hypothetical protein
MGGMTVPPNGPSAGASFFGAPPQGNQQNPKSSPPSDPNMPRPDTMGGGPGRYGGMDMGYDAGESGMPIQDPNQGSMPIQDPNQGSMPVEDGVEFNPPALGMTDPRQQKMQDMLGQFRGNPSMGVPMQAGEAMQPVTSQSPAGQRMIQSMRRMSRSQ